MDPFKKKCLLEGLDDIALSLKKSDKIEKFETNLKDKNHGFLMIKVKKEKYFYYQAMVLDLR
uniref:Uncharacterized protein n=1 Tax=uncultured marine bacterium MedDCM-OCT-S08-C1068 TaxID=743068 RepID=D6PJI2_9BACT|nr:hypothetical protein [uncultured marine bacterium MedDCM-OCT-S08-C1068]